MYKDKQKSVRFSAKAGSISTNKANSGSLTCDSNDEEEIASEKSPSNSLSTKNTNPPPSPSPDICQDSWVEDAALNNCFSAERTNQKLESNPDKPNLHDTHSRLEYADLPSSPDPNHSFIQPIINPLEKVTYYPPPLAEFPPTLNELITNLEQEQFSTDTENHNMEFSMRSTGNYGELNELTERLHSYIKRMRELRNGAPNLDSRTFFKSVDAMEHETKNLKIVYEREVSNLRQQLEAMSRQNSQFQLQNSKLEATASDLQIRMAAEAEKSNRLSAEMISIRKEFQMKEVEYQAMMQETMEQMKASSNVDETNRKLDQTLRENMELHRRYESELLMRQEYESKVHQLEEKIRFNEELYTQQQLELQNRLAEANTVMITLDSKVQSLSQPGSTVDITQMLATVKEAAEKDLFRYKQDVEELYSKNVVVLKSQMEADRKSLESLSDENRNLVAMIEELNIKIKTLEGEIFHVRELKRVVEESIMAERQQSSRHIQAMQLKMKDLQEVLFVKLTELNSARIETLPLKAEVESMRAFAEEEEKRLNLMQINSYSSTFPDEMNPSPRMVGTTLGKSTVTSTNYSAIRGEESAQDAVRRTIQVEPATRFESNTKLLGTGASSNLIGPVRAKSCQSHADETLEVSTSKVAVSNGVSGVVSHDYNRCTNSATGDLRVHNIASDGKSICLENTSSETEYDFGGYVLQQQVGGHPVANFRFPPKTKFVAKSYITIYSGCNDPILHQPPTQFVWKEQDRWGTGPECITILCKPNGQAVAWMTAAHRFGAFEAQEESSTEQGDGLGVFTKNPNANPPNPILLKRQKDMPPSLAPQNHPHGNVYKPVHSRFNENRVRDLGNDNSSNQRDTRSQSDAVPDRVPGQAYTGASGQRMGSFALRRYTPLNASGGNIRKNGAITNRSGSRETSEPPSSFMTPKNRHTSGVQQIQSQHHSGFCPPMPRPPLFAS